MLDRTRVEVPGGRRVDCRSIQKANQIGLLLDWGVGLRKRSQGDYPVFGTGSWWYHSVK